MNRGSVKNIQFGELSSTGFNEAPIHESGKSFALGGFDRLQR